MPSALRRLLRAPTFADQTKTRQAAAVYGLVLFLLVITVPILPTVDFFGPTFTSILALDAVLAVLLVSVRRGNVRAASMAVPVIVLVEVSFTCIVGNGIRDISIIGFFLVSGIAGLLLGKRALVLYTGLSIAVFAAMTHAEVTGVLVTQFSFATQYNQIVQFASLLLLFAFLLYLTQQYLIYNLERAERNERALAEQNALLEASRAEIQLLNAGLEQRIAERTKELRSATRNTSQLYLVSRDINGATSYTEIVDAVARHLDQPRFRLGLSIYENFDKATASTLTLVAVRPGGDHEVVPMQQDFPIAIMERWVEDGGLTVVDDSENPPPDMPQITRDYLKQNEIRSFQVAEFAIGGRIMGVFTVALPHPNGFCERDHNFMLAVSDLTAAAVERMRLYAEQVQLAEQLREADEVKSRFLASMSHELRTPLNAILNFTRFVSNGMLGPVNPQQLDALSKTITSGKHLLTLINDVLDVTKIESNMLNLFVEPEVDLHAELSAVAATAESLLADKPIQLITDIASDLPLIVGDRRRIRQVLLNLVSNAAKFTDEGEIVMSARAEGDRVILSVRDTGPGIPSEEHEAIFEPFRQSQRGLSMGGGTGLGLAIARRLVEAHQGHLRLDSTPGQGARFTIELPVNSEVLRQQIDALSEAEPQ